MNETSHPQTLAPLDAFPAGKWSGMAVTVLVLLVLWAAYGWTASMIAAVGCFSTLMICIGAETESAE